MEKQEIIKVVTHLLAFLVVILWGINWASDITEKHNQEKNHNGRK